MTALARADPIAFLRRGGLLTAVLALLAGIIGMHVMNAAHDMQSPALAGETVGAHHGTAVASHAGEYAPVPEATPGKAAAQDTAVARTVQCTDADGCTSMQSMNAGCTPLAKTGSLDAPMPGTAFTVRNANEGRPGALSLRWSYLPGSPSPGELSISRT